MQPVDELGPGEVGYLIGSVKDVADTRRSSVDFPETSAAVEGAAQGESVVGAVDPAVLQATLQGLQLKSSK